MADNASEKYIRGIEGLLQGGLEAALRQSTLRPGQTAEQVKLTQRWIQYPLTEIAHGQRDFPIAIRSTANEILGIFDGLCTSYRRYIKNEESDVGRDLEVFDEIIERQQALYGGMPFWPARAIREARAAIEGSA